MDNTQIASTYVLAKICGFSGSFNDFKIMYDQYYSEAIKELDNPSKKYATVKAFERPF